MAGKGVNFEAQLFDIHPRIKIETDGRVKKYLELKLQTAAYDPRLLQQLIGMHGGVCSVSIEKTQVDITFTRGKKADVEA